ncbi:MAG: hypothetical protein WC926_01635 [Candidatus Paceibacterota bacterium]|jgi:hypothetical protein
MYNYPSKEGRIKDKTVEIATKATRNIQKALILFFDFLSFNIAAI